MKQITKNQKVLTKEEEQEAFKKYRMLDIALQNTKDEAKKQKILDTKAKLKNFIFERNIGLVFASTKKMSTKIRTDVEFDDMFQYACLGLLKAIDGFNAYEGYKFSSYAIRVIDSNIYRKSNEEKTIHIPEKVTTEYISIQKKLNTRTDDGTYSDIKTVADEIGRPHEYVASLLNIFQYGEVTDDWLFEKENNFLNEFEEKFLIRDISSCLDCLNFDERSILTFYYGLENNPSMTCQEIADVVGVTKSAISARLKTIIEKLKDEKILTHWRGYEAS